MAAGAIESTSVLDIVKANDTLVKDTKIRRVLLLMKRKKLERQLLRELISLRVFVRKSEQVSKRWDIVGGQLHTLMRSKFQQEQILRPSSLPEVGIGYSLLKRFLEDPQRKRKSKQQTSF